MNEELNNALYALFNSLDRLVEQALKSEEAAEDALHWIHAAIEQLDTGIE